MSAHYHLSHDNTVELEEIPHASMIAYRRHVAARTVPAAGVPYTRSDISQWKHKTLADALDYRMKLPALPPKMEPEKRKFPRGSYNYIKEYYDLNNLKFK